MLDYCAIWIKWKKKKNKKKESLLSRARKINSLAKIDLQILPVAVKLERCY